MANESNWSPLIHSPQWRYSLKQLFAWMALFALGCVALRSANTTWVSAMLGLTLLTLAASLLFALYREGRDRAYWIGFATIGWLYVLVLLYAWSLDVGRYGGNPLNPADLVTTRLSDKVFAWMYPPRVVSQPAGYGMGGMSPPGGGPMTMGGMAEGMEGGMGAAGAMMGYGSMAGAPTMSGTVTFTLPAIGPSQQDFVNVAHALWTLLLAACGGWLAMWIYATRGKRAESGTGA